MVSFALKEKGIGKLKGKSISFSYCGVTNCLHNQVLKTALISLLAHKSGQLGVS